MNTKLALPSITASLLWLTLSGCATQDAATASTRSTLLKAREALAVALNQCTQGYGYDPHAVSGISEHALAPTEFQWRQCAYDAVREYEKSNPALSSLYEQLIAEDIQMTTAIQQGTLTRAQRQARIDALIAQIEQAEEDALNKYAYDREVRARQLMHTLYGFSGARLR